MFEKNGRKEEIVEIRDESHGDRVLAIAFLFESHRITQVSC
jgi:hypothetical protein